ncbi:MAG: CpaF family protein [Deltaproteobacteria bacterium]|nr:CpaF family protein [Deltaproteobacteria bacterium]
MDLHQRLQKGKSRTNDIQGPPEMVPHIYQQIKAEIHNQLIDELDLSKFDVLESDDLQKELRGAIEAVANVSALPLNRHERERLVQEVIDEVTGLGPLEPLLADPSISDILVNGYNTVYIERKGLLSKVPVTFRDDAHLMQIINRIVTRVGRRVDESSPMVDARLMDGSRVNAIIPPLALDGPSLSIRRFGTNPLTIDKLVQNNSMTENMKQFLAACVRARLNVLISGGTGTGKTTLLNAVSAFIPNTERIVTIEDAAELQLQQPHVVRLETRPANIEGKGAIVARDLVVNSLRMRPDRIIVGEVRSAEVMDMLQAMNTGHEGSMTTVHANSPRDSLARLVAMAGLFSAHFSETLMNHTLASALDLVVHINRFSDGTRKVVSISEISGMEGNVISLQEVFAFRQTGVDAEGRALGKFMATGIRPRCMERIERAGFSFDGTFTS